MYSQLERSMDVQTNEDKRLVPTHFQHTQQFFTLYFVPVLVVRSSFIADVRCGPAKKILREGRTLQYKSIVLKGGSTLVRSIETLYSYSHKGTFERVEILKKRRIRVLHCIRVEKKKN